MKITKIKSQTQSGPLFKSSVEMDVLAVSYEAVWELDAELTLPKSRPCLGTIGIEVEATGE